MQAPMRVYANTTFSIQPKGDAYGRKGIMDALSVGNIPIIFSPRAFWFPWFFDFDKANGTILLHLPSLGEDVEQIVKYAHAISATKLAAMQAAIHGAGPALGYSGCPETGADGVVTRLITAAAEAGPARPTLA
jgi:hypothetical protein